MFKGVLYLAEMPDYIFCNIKIFFKFKFELIYTVKRQKLNKKLKIPQGRCTTPPNVPKLGVSGVKDTAKPNKYLGMLCYIQVEYSLLFRW